MNRDEIRLSLERVFREVFDQENYDFSDALSRENLESWDSLGHIRLISATEEQFGIRFTLDEIESLTSAGQIVELVCART